MSTRETLDKNPAALMFSSDLNSQVWMIIKPSRLLARSNEGALKKLDTLVMIPSPMKKNIFLALALVALLNACAHAPGGFLVQRGSNTYDLFVGGAVSQKEESFFQGAFEICRKNHNAGFEVSNRSSNSYGSIEATIACKGPVDKFMADKYLGTTIQLERNDSKYDGGYRYEVTRPAQ